MMLAPFVFADWVLQGWQVRRHNNDVANLSWTLRGPGNDDWYASKNINDNKWHHIVCQFQSSVSREIWIDGVRIAQEVRGGSIAATNSMLAFGCRDNDGNFAFAPAGFSRAFMDDVRIYNRILNQAEITDLSAISRQIAIPLRGGGSIIYKGSLAEDLTTNPPTWKSTGSFSEIADSIKAAIEDDHGHNGEIVVTSPAPGELTLTQSTTGVFNQSLSGNLGGQSPDYLSGFGGGVDEGGGVET